MQISFTVYGDPKAQKRHRSFKINDRIGNYDPSKSDKQDFIAQIINNKPEAPIMFPCIAEISFYMPIPKTAMNKKIKKLAAQELLGHTKKPDIDNLLKFVFDSITGIFIYDDNQIFKITAQKIYSEKPRTEVKIISENIEMIKYNIEKNIDNENLTLESVK